MWGELSPPEYGVLYALSNAPNGLRITELGNDVLLTQPGMSRLIARLEAAGLVVSGTYQEGRLVEVVELPDHPWFVASQFHPEFKSRPTRPAPLFREFVGAALDRARERAGLAVRASV